MPADTSTRRKALEWLGRYIEALDEPAIADLARRLSDFAADSIPELDEPGIRADLYALARESVRSFFASLPLDRLREPEVSVASLEFTRGLARRGLEPSILHKVYRLGQAEFWRAVMVVAEREIPDDALRMGVLTVTWERLSLWLEPVVERQVEVFEEERERWVRGALARRQETIEAILADEDVDPAHASQVLAHELTRYQVALALWADENAGIADAASRLELLATELAAALGSRRVLTTPSGARALWAWIGSNEAPDLERVRAAPALAAAEGLRVAVGRPGRGLRGFRESHREALAAQRIAIAGVRRDTVITYPDVEVVSLISGDQAAMRRLVERELAGLLTRDAPTARLRETALAFLGASSNARVAAELLGTHKNTVLYRLRRVEELLGRPITERRLTLELALTVVDTLGERVLPEPDSAPR